MNENTITVSGNVIAEPEMRQTKGGHPMLTFRVASNHRYFNSRTGQWEEGVTNYYDVVAFRQLALNTGASLHKGYAVYVQGQLRQRRFTRQDGSSGMSCEIEARTVGPDLSFGIAQWMRRPKTTTAGQSAAAGEAQPWGQHSSESEPTGLPDPDRVGFTARRDHEDEETYDEVRVDENGVILDPPGMRSEEEVEEPAA
ncbi:single-stranded DNA-binding protein [Nostocoides sp. F2B08]|uniref:single-stranded DNA-binding protein n=1 Tax=Nostocoides sp. F2B08 TaxID=2653936 RepID=UPI0012635EEB|nr:single-stranded DNA-binding protein [Tetrasphaera sp. F2B08]KAB7743263.1 single-stranded DNA-binding protein [Tetrasphaera sp. F2B08]